MGPFLNNLFYYVITAFEAVGEATIQIRNLLLKLIVLFIKIVNFIGVMTILFLTFLSRSILFLFNVLSQYAKKTTILRLPFFSFPHFTIKHTLPSPRVTMPKVHISLPKQKRETRIARPIVAFFFGFILSVLTIAAPIGAIMLSQSLPNPHMLTARSIPVTTKILDRNGELLYEIYADENRTPVPLAEIPDHFKKATLAIEDQDFYRHHGFSLSGITRATYSILKNHEIQGGSTLTQQLVRSALLSPEVSFNRKLKELILSVWSEQIYTKDQILEMYFNQIPYGGTAWGAETAAQTYFGKSIRDVNLAEAALLAGLPAAPSTYSPFGSHPELAKNRQKEVLRRMQEDGYITRDEREQAENTQLSYRQPNIGIQAPHFVMYVKDLLAKQYGIHRVEQGGLRVTTTLDMSLQQRVQDIVASDVANLKQLKVDNGAAVVTNPRTGEILVMVGSTNYFDIKHDGNVNVALTQQQPGSSIKVVTYAAALQHGFTAATLLNDSPITYHFVGSPSYSPVNYDGRFHGYVPLRYALGNSYNVPAVKTLEKVGLPTMMEQARKMGINSWDDSSFYGLSLTLGAGEVTMLEMASAYGTLANNGEYIELSPILQVEDYLGHTIADNRFKVGTQALPAETAFIISDILSDNNARSSAFGSNSLLNIPGSWVAVKTGTSNEKRDNWAIGYTKDFVVTTWVGNNDNSPMDQVLTSGITGATPIWRKITDYLLVQHPSIVPQAPGNIVRASCRGKNEYFIAGTEKNACSPLPEQKKEIADDKQNPFTVNAQEPEKIQPEPTKQSTRNQVDELKKKREKKRN